jgi:hypothetical protein
MKINTRIVVIAAIILLIVIVVVVNWRVWFPKKPRKPEVAAKAKGSVPPATRTGQAIGNGTGFTATNLNTFMVLHQGMVSPEVQELQHVMNIADPGAGLDEDSNFGADTLGELQDLTGQSTITLELAYRQWVAGYQDTVQKDKSNFKILGFN